jgi:hypothetical protein
MMRRTLLALSALSLPGLAAAQYTYPMPQPSGPVRAEPWMAPPPGAQAPRPWGQAHRATNQRSRGPALEPIDLPPAIEQGVDMIYIDEELVPRAVQDSRMLHEISFDAWSGAPVDLFVPVNPVYTDLRRGLVRYQQRWADLPQTPVPAGPTLKPGSTDERVAMLRQRLGLPDGALPARGRSNP